MSDITAVILAAGENTRLAGIVAPYQKPLILINGVPLIRQAIIHAAVTWGAKHHVIVCSPNNAREVTNICGEQVRYVIQPRPSGVIDAVHIALQSVNTPRVLLMCADNIFETFPHCEPNTGVNLIGTSKVRDRRFTPICVSSADLVVYEDGSDVEIVSWVGPILHNKDDFMRAARNASTIPDFIASLPRLKSFPMNCSDIGIPEALS